MMGIAACLILFACKKGGGRMMGKEPMFDAQQTKPQRILPPPFASRRMGHPRFIGGLSRERNPSRSGA